MSLIERLEKQAKEFERLNYMPFVHYDIGAEDVRALLTEAAERIKGLSLLVDRKQGKTYYDPIDRRRIYGPGDRF